LLNSSRKSEFGESGHWRISTGDVSKTATDRPLSKMRQCAIGHSHCPKADFQPMNLNGNERTVRHLFGALKETRYAIIGSPRPRAAAATAVL
jgi:hypothetical protein